MSMDSGMFGPMSTVPCARCGEPVPTVPTFERLNMRKHVLCPSHQNPYVPEERAMTIEESWRRRVPEQFRGAAIDGILDPMTRRIVAAYAKGWPDAMPPAASFGGLLLGGPTGIRKTGACYALLNHLVANRRVRPNEILVRREEEWLPELAKVSRFATTKERRDAFRVALDGKRILMLDDLGYGRYASPGDRESVILGLMERVDKSDILLLVTTNTADPETLRQIVGPAAFSRLWKRVGQEVWVPGSVDTRLDKGTPHPGLRVVQDNPG